MSNALMRIGLGVYAACVDFMLGIASLAGVTYRDANAIVLLLGFPLCTLGLVAVCVAQRIRLAKRRVPTP